MHRMWEETAVPYLRAQGWSDSTIVSQTLRFWGVSESALAEQVHAFFDSANPTVAPYANRGEVKLRVAAKAATVAEAEAMIAPVTAQLLQLVGADCYGCDDDTLAGVVGQGLVRRGETLAVAESCTGGGLGALLTATAGSSRYFRGGVISYDNQVKVDLLGVDPAVLAQQGAVSGDVAEQMAAGVRARLGTDWGVSITGIAGPDGGSAEKPVGLVYVGIAGPDGSVSSRAHQFGDRGREWIRHVSACTVLDQLRRRL
jgi:nicotinamide-nucleotide amidase